MNRLHWFTNASVSPFDKRKRQEKTHSTVNIFQESLDEYTYLPKYISNNNMQWYSNNKYIKAVSLLINPFGRFLWLYISRYHTETSLVIQWLSLHFPMQGAWVQSPVEEQKSHMTQGQKNQNIKQKLWHKSQQDPLWPTSQSIGNKGKNKQMGPD